MSGDPVRRPAPRLFFLTGERLDSMADFPALPLWTDALLADTTHLSNDEIGAYLLLLIASWRRPNCDLPDDDAFLAKISRCTPEDWTVRMRPVMLQFFSIAQNPLGYSGLWIQKRLVSERAKVQARSDRARANGKSGGRPPSNKNNDLENPAGSCSVTQKKAILNHIHIHNDSSLRSESLRARDDAIALDGFDAFWAACPRKIGKGGAQRSYARALTQASAADLLAAMKRHAERVRGKDPKYIPHPATWLNQQRWLDEPDPLSRRDATLKALGQIGGTDGE